MCSGSAGCGALRWCRRSEGWGTGENRAYVSFIGAIVLSFVCFARPVASRTGGNPGPRSVTSNILLCWVPAPDRGRGQACAEAERVNSARAVTHLLHAPPQIFTGFSNSVSPHSYSGRPKSESAWMGLVFALLPFTATGLEREMLN